MGETTIIVPGTIGSNGSDRRVRGSNRKRTPRVGESSWGDVGIMKPGAEVDVDRDDSAAAAGGDP
jgi:hypothetical protein